MGKPLRIKEAPSNQLYQAFEEAGTDLAQVCIDVAVLVCKIVVFFGLATVTFLCIPPRRQPGCTRPLRRQALTWHRCVSGCASVHPM
jgi:hypothetical protein